MRVKKRSFAILLFLCLLLGSVFMNVGAASYQETETEQGTESAKKNAKAAAETPQEQGTESETVLETAKKPEPETVSENGKKQEQETEKTKKKQAEEKETSAETKAGMESENLGVSGTGQSEETQPQAMSTGIVLETPDDVRLAALIPDANFRKAIFQSLRAYGWLSGDPEKPPQSVQEILETYTGSIDGDGFGKADADKIRSIEGIGYLKMATTSRQRSYIELGNNLIEDITPITDVCTTDFYHYGFRIDGDYSVGAPVRIDLINNPIRYIPKMDHTGIRYGYLVFMDMSENNPAYEEDPHFYFLREEKETFSDVVRIGYCRFKISDEYISLPRFEVMSTTAQSVGVNFEKTKDGPNKNEDVDGILSNLRKSGRLQLGLWSDASLATMSINPAGQEVPVETMMAYSIYPIVTIFDKVELNSNYMGRAQLQKLDRVSGNPINGAVYNFYKKIENGEDQLIKGNLVTATREVTVYDEETGQYVKQNLPGYTEVVENLDAGTYYFQEVQAPVGYEVDQTPIEITVEQFHSYISGGEKELDYTSYSGNKVQASARENETYVTRDVKEKAHLFLGNSNQNEYDDAIENDVVKEVKVTYRSLNGKDQADVKTYATFQEAEDALHIYVKGNNITGSVKMEVVYDENSTLVLKKAKAGDTPLYTKVHIQKTWVGLSGDEILPEVTYRLFRNIEGSDKKEEINSFTVPKGSPKEAYSHTFETDSKGNLLRQYDTDSAGNTFRYEYSIVEECDSDEYMLGTPGKPTDLTIETTLENGESDAGGSLITIPVSNYKKASIHIIKVDANDSDRKLSGVEFKLEKKSGETWEEADFKTTNESGEVLYENLGSGDYRVTETKTQAGYVLLKDPILVTIGDLTEENYQRELAYTVENSRSYRLPVTGGPGRELVIITGLLGIIAACVLWIRKQQFDRKKR